MTILSEVDQIRVAANGAIDPKRRGELGQFFTSAPIALFMASLFDDIQGQVRLLDPGCGPCSLTAAFTDEAIRRGQTSSVHVDAFDIECAMVDHISESLKVCRASAGQEGVKFDANFELSDFILKSGERSGLLSDGIDVYTHVIMNPPYKKIATASAHRRALRACGVETVNLYSGFVALAIQKLCPGGELVAIVPRSFCNGPYYQPFREMMLRDTAIRHIHIFDSRNTAFSEDEVLQENVIIHLVKSAEQKEVTVTSSPVADFHLDAESGTVTATDKTTRNVFFRNIVVPGDKHQFIHIAANARDQAVVDRLAAFTSTLEDVSLQVSTGPVVSFRLREDLRQEIEPGAVPLLFPAHLNGGYKWPIESKPNAINVSERSSRWLWRHSGDFVIVKRFSSKEERRRISASVYDSALGSELVGFDNKLNVFHYRKQGIDRDVALGLYVYLNSTLVDKYYRLFGGHTQVNAADLRALHYPGVESTKRMGRKVRIPNLTQREIDNIVEDEIERMTGEADNSLMAAQEKIDQALEILKNLGMPKAQLNERSALTLLALLNLTPQNRWRDSEKPMLGVTPIMDWSRDSYGKEYAPNTRETFRRQTLHQFVDGGICLYNPDQPNRAVNSPRACYQIAPELYEVLLVFGTQRWQSALKGWLENRQTLIAQYARERDMNLIPLVLPDGAEIKLSPGDHSKLIHDIVVEFGPRFAPGSEVIYLGDTGGKVDFFRQKRLGELGVVVDQKGKLPDVVLYSPKTNWLFLVESVTSHGPVDGKRYGELAALFSSAKPGLVYVTAFPDRKIMNKYLAVIAWETEVWVADSPTHMVHFNGDRFLGPHT